MCCSEGAYLQLGLWALSFGQIQKSVVFEVQVSISALFAPSLSFQTEVHVHKTFHWRCNVILYFCDLLNGRMLFNPSRHCFPTVFRDSVWCCSRERENRYISSIKNRLSPSVNPQSVEMIYQTMVVPTGGTTVERNLFGKRDENMLKIGSKGRVLYRQDGLASK